jgi:hypothetical protein
VDEEIRVLLRMRQTTAALPAGGFVVLLMRTLVPASIRVIFTVRYRRKFDFDWQNSGGVYWRWLSFGSQQHQTKFDSVPKAQICT